jgi:heme-degrading monooxygenase HmoA
MPALLIRQRVSDYDVWKRAFADQEFARTANGCQGVQIFRNTDDPNETIVILAWDSLVRARLFSQSDELLESIARGRDDQRPDIWILDDIF